jgi:phosphonoacetaldehyde hydrolase
MKATDEMIKAVQEAKREARETAMAEAKTEAMAEAKREALVEAKAAAVALAGEVLTRAGAHYLIDTVADLPAVIDDIERRLAAGERPVAGDE